MLKKSDFLCVIAYCITIHTGGMLRRQQKSSMKDYITDLTMTSLFADIAPYDIEELLGCIHARRVEYAKGNAILEEGSHVNHFGIILSGRGRAVKQDAAGRPIIITLLEKGNEIGVILAASYANPSPVSVQAYEDTCVLMIPFNGILNRCQKSCVRHNLLLRNYIKIVADKGLLLHERINCLLKPTVRDKIMTYLIRISHKQRKTFFIVPLDRNAMAEYLNVDRSALSRELSKMKRDGLIDYHKSVFKLL